MTLMYRLKLIMSIYWRKLKRRCGNRDMENLERWYATEYNIPVPDNLIPSKPNGHRSSMVISPIDHKFEFKSHHSTMIGRKGQRIRVGKNGRIGFDGARGFNSVDMDSNLSIKA